MFTLTSAAAAQVRQAAQASGAQSMALRIAASIEAGLVKPDEEVGRSRRFARYLPFWA